MLADASGNELGPEETSWSTREHSFHCVQCHAEAIEIQSKRHHH